jgi:3-dehydroquinate dehydratase
VAAGPAVSRISPVARRILVGFGVQGYIPAMSGLSQPQRGS